MSDSLRSARIKLKRANLHAGIARREARRFFERQSDPVFRIDPHGEPSDFRIGSPFACKVVVEKGWPDLPESFAARFGDALHNYRCVLDHIAWRLVSNGLMPPDTMDERAKRRISFPAYSTAQTFKDRIATCLPGVDPMVIGWIKARNKYVGGKSTNDSLMSLVELSNDDKHRTLTAIVAAPAKLEGYVTFTRCKPIAVSAPNQRPALKDKAELQYWEGEITGLNPNVSMQLQPTIEIVVEGRPGFGNVLEDIRVEVTEILNAPEIIAAVT